VLFVAGRPAKVRTSDPVAYLGRTLVELGHLDEPSHARSLSELADAKSHGSALHGQVLLAAGLEPSRLEAGLNEQIVRKLRVIAAFAPETTYEYLAGFDGLADWGLEVAHGLDVTPIVWRLLRESPPRTHVDAAIERIAAAPLRLARSAQLARLTLDKEEVTAAELLRVRPMRVDEFVTASGLGPVARLLAYLLLVTKQVDVLRPSSAGHSTPPPPVRSASDSPSPPPPLASHLPPPRDSLRPAPQDSLRPAPQDSLRPMPTPSYAVRPTAGYTVRPTPSYTRPAMGASLPPPTRLSSPKPPPLEPVKRSTPSVPPTLAPELRQRWIEIADRAATIDRSDYFSMLDIARDASQDEVESAFFVQAKKWHPDRLPPELASLRDPCSRVFARINEAHATLADPEQRAQYMRLMADGSGSPAMQETVAKVVEAVTHFQKAEVCFRRNDMAQAEAFCRKAVDNDPTQPDYLAMLAWLLALKPENQSPEKTRASIQMLDRALEMSEKCERAYFWRGMLLQRLGRPESAVRDFKRAVNLNPRNIDAAREIRLYRMRGGRHTSHPPANPSSSGVPAARSDPPKAEDTKSGIFGRFFKK
jgi:tetratricopeptide (TPR) repeat protein